MRLGRRRGWREGARDGVSEERASQGGEAKPVAPEGRRGERNASALRGAASLSFRGLTCDLGGRPVTGSWPGACAHSCPPLTPTGARRLPEMLEPRLESAQDQDLDLYEHVEDAEDETFPPFPPPASPLAEDGEGPERAEQAEPESGRRIPVPVKRAKRSIPRLDAQRLISERGLPTLRHVFDKAKFKGKGHEAEDLKTLIRHMEHWAHRLFPKLQFEDFIDRVESLGNKKEVQTCLKRIRLDLPILHEDFIGGNDAVEEHEGREGPVSEPDPFLMSLSESQRPAVEPSGCLTEEQQQRMERNKQLAWERRQAKLLSASQAPESDCSLVAPTAPIAGSEGGMTEHPEEQGFNGWDTDEPDGPRNSGAAHREDSPIEMAPLDQCP